MQGQGKRAGHYCPRAPKLVIDNGCYISNHILSELTDFNLAGFNYSLYKILILVTQ